MDWKSKLIEKRFYYIVGLAGVDEHEGRAVRRCGSVFSWLMVLVAVVLLIEWQLKLLGEISLANRFFIDWFVFLFFLVSFTTQVMMVKDHWRFIGQNWSLPLIIIFGIPFLVNYQPMTQVLAALRPILAIYILFPSIKVLISFFIDGQLRTTLLAATVIVVIFGLLVAGVDPAVKTPWDGIWWALATVSTIGYGDVVPVSALGRLIGVILMVVGLAIFVTITANILAFILKKERKAFKREEKEVDELVQEMQELKKTQQESIELLKELSQKVSDKPKPSSQEKKE